MNNVQYNEHRSVMAQSSPREIQRRAVRERILEAARDSMIREGYENFSMRGLARRVGYSPGTIYLYFRDKRDLLDQLIASAFDKLLEMLHAVHDDQDAVRSLRNKLRVYIEFGLQHPNHYHFAFVLRRRRSQEPLVPHPSFDVLRGAVARCIDEGAFHSRDAETTSQVLWATIHGLTSLLIVIPQFPWVEKEELINRLIDTAIDGLSGPGRSVKRQE